MATAKFPREVIQIYAQQKIASLNERIAEIKKERVEYEEEAIAALMRPVWWRRTRTREQAEERYNRGLGWRYPAIRPDYHPPTWREEHELIRKVTLILHLAWATRDYVTLSEAEVKLLSMDDTVLA